MFRLSLPIALSLAALVFAPTFASAQPPVLTKMRAGPTLDWFIGQWTDDNNCNNAIRMHEDGRFTNTDGTGGRWALDGDRLTLSGKDGELTVTLVRDGADALTLVHADGSEGYSTRCPERGQ